MQPVKGSRVHHDTVVVPTGTSSTDAHDAAARKASRNLSPDQEVAFVYLHGCRSVPEGDAQVEWRYSYQVGNVTADGVRQR